jgi:hypothetical protein
MCTKKTTLEKIYDPEIGPIEPSYRRFIWLFWDQQRDGFSVLKGGKHDLDPRKFCHILLWF